MQIGLATSSTSQVTELVLSALEIASYFGCLVTRDDVDQSKPHPESYLTASEALGVSPDRCVALEDSPRGVASASSAGMFVAALRTPYFRDADLSQADILIDELNELVPHLVRDD